MKYINKTSGSIRLAALLAGAALFGLASQNALAAALRPAPHHQLGHTDVFRGSGGAAVVTGLPRRFWWTKKSILCSRRSHNQRGANDTAKVLTYTVTNTANSLLDFTLSIIQPAQVISSMPPHATYTLKARWCRLPGRGGYRSLH